MIFNVIINIWLLNYHCNIQQPTGTKIWPEPGPGLPSFGRDRDSPGIGIWPEPGAGTGIFGRDFYDFYSQEGPFLPNFGQAKKYFSYPNGT